MKKDIQIVYEMKQHNSAIRIQTTFRSYYKRQKYLKTVINIIKLQRWWKDILNQKRMYNATQIQKNIRKWLTQKKYIALKNSVEIISTFYLKWVKPHLKSINRLQNELQRQQQEIERLREIERKYKENLERPLIEIPEENPLIEIPLNDDSHFQKTEQRHIKELEKYDMKIQELLERENERIEEISELEKYKENMKRAISEKMKLTERMEKLERDNHRIRIAYARKHLQSDCIIC